MKMASLKWMPLTCFVALLCAGCGSGGTTSNGPSVFALNVTSLNPTSGVIVTASPLDNNGAGAVATSGPLAGMYPATTLSYVYKKGTSVTLTATQATQISGPFFAWTGCDSTSGLTCTVSMTGPKSVQVQYAGVSSLVLAPINPAIGVPGTVQFTTTVQGVGMCTEPPPPGSPAMTPPMQVLCSQSSYTYALTGTTYPSGFAPTSPGTIDPVTGIYTAPFAAPATVTVTVVSTVNPSAIAVTTITLNPTIPTTGPPLSVDLASPTHAISPYIYGMNDYGMKPGLPALVDLPIERWGGDATTRYNYTNDADNSAADFFFENSLGTGSKDNSSFNAQVTLDHATNTKTLATVPLIGYTTLPKAACSYSVTKYASQGAQQTVNGDCGNGTLASDHNKNIVNDPTDTSYVIDQTFDAGWVSYLDGKFGTAANGGIAMYALDNEPEYWSGVHKDVKKTPLTYDSLTNGGLTYAAAIKGADPTALVTGPVISNWGNYFISQADTNSGYGVGPNYNCPYASANADYTAHGSVPLVEYYLQQFAAAEKSGGTRLLDYLDLHTYFAAKGAAFSTAGSPGLQDARLDSTRVFWDPTYTDPSNLYPVVFKTGNSDPCGATATQAAPMLIPRAKGWVKNDYPGTKVAFTEYNWGGQESMNGALALADILGIFGREGLDMATLWGPPDPATQFPAVAAFQMYTNYDGSKSKFGDMALPSVSGQYSYLSVYGAQRTSDKAITVMVLNKGASDQTSTLSLLHTTASGNATSYQFTPANLQAVVAGPTYPITAPAAGATTSTITGTFPAQSITLLVIPQ